VTHLVLKPASASHPSCEWKEEDHDVLAEGVTPTVMRLRQIDRMMQPASSRAPARCSSLKAALYYGMGDTLATIPGPAKLEGFSLTELIESTANELRELRRRPRDDDAVIEFKGD
jgi:hypothetical protein